MIACKIIHLKEFMSHLLIQGSFDAFWLSEASITTRNTFTIDGALHPEFFSEEDREILERRHRTHSLWKEVKPFCYSIIRGKRTPLQFRIVFRLSYEKTRQALSACGVALDPDQVDGLFLNVQYHGGKVTCTTGTSVKTFTTDRSLEQVWDRMVLKFFQKLKIEHEDA